MKSHECKKFRTAKKENGVRRLVKCRECGREIWLPVASRVGKEEKNERP